MKLRTLTLLAFTTLLAQPFMGSELTSASGVDGGIPQATAATPTFSPAAGTYSTAQTVKITDTTTGATIYYTVNGTTPTTSSTKYTAAITVSAT
jgi:hypothetical protein